MEVMYQRRCANYIYSVPEGLKELMSDITREVLRAQPQDLFDFIASYLEALMITRENARVAAKTITNLAETSEVVADLLIRTNMTKEQANKTCSVIQKAFRKHLRHRSTRHESVEKEPLLDKIIKKTGVTFSQARNAVCVIQRAYRNFRLRRIKDQRKDVVDWRTAYRKTMSTYRRSGVTKQELDHAATLIKAAYKGYYTRRVLCRMLEETALPDMHPKIYVRDREAEEGDVNMSDSWYVRETENYKREKAAKIIQAAFRKYLGKKKVASTQASFNTRTAQYDNEFEEFVQKSSSFAPDYTITDEQEVYIETEEFDAMCEEIQLAAIEMDAMPLGETSESNTGAYGSPHGTNEDTQRDLLTENILDEN